VSAPDCGNTVAARVATVRRDVFARRAMPAFSARRRVPAHVHEMAVRVEFLVGLFVRMAGGSGGRKCERKKARRDHQCPFHGIVL